jgi:hypothetical protein
MKLLDARVCGLLQARFWDRPSSSTLLTTPVLRRAVPYITAEEAWEAAYSAIGEPIPAR